MKLNKKQREKLKQKYGGNCAYCGCELGNKWHADHIEAVKYFQRYRSLESSAASDWEADIAIAYDSMLSQSPFYDPQAARKSYQQLRKKQPKEARVHEQALLMRDALATFSAMSKQIDGLQKDNAKLTASLKKREEALRRLRELALGQKGGLP